MNKLKNIELSLQEMLENGVIKIPYEWLASSMGLTLIGIIGIDFFLFQ